MAYTFNQVGKRELLSKSVEAQIEAAIRAGIYLPGAKLPTEFEMCEQFGVSRTAIREALRMLSARNLVTIEKGRGVFVNRPTAESVTSPLELYLSLNQANVAIDVVHARQIIEPPVAATAALHRSDDDLEILAANIQALKGGDEDDHELLTNLDMEFHLDIARATTNVVVPLILEPIHLLMPTIKKAVYDEIADARASAIEWHGRIFDAIKRSDADGAFEAMTRHLKIAEEHVLRARHLD